MFRTFHKLRKSCTRSLQRWGNYARWRYFETIHGTGKWARSLKRVSHATAADIEGDLLRRPSLKGRNYVNPVFWVLQGVSFLLRYLTSRRFRDLLVGLPSVSGAMFIVVSLGWFVPPADQIIARARTQLNMYRQDKNYAAARFYADIWLARSGNSDEAVFEKALLLESDGQTDDARLLLTQLHLQRRYLPALNRLCLNDLQLYQDSRGEDRDLRQRLEPLLLRYIELQPENPSVGLMLGTFYMLSLQDAQALPILERVTARSVNLPEAWYALAIVRARLGSLGEARVAASTASDLFLQRDARQGYSFDRAMQTVRALIVAQREAEAIQICEGALKSADNDSLVRLQQVIAEVCAAWVSRLRSQPNPAPRDLAMAVTVLARGLQAAPYSPFILEELTQFALRSEQLTNGADKDLENLLYSGIQPGIVHFILGTRALQASPPDQKEALRHFQLAMQHDAGYPGVLNNLANTIAETPDGDHQNALALINKALELMPGQPYFHDTRGRLHMRLGQPVPAIADFERALEAVELRPAVHRRLAQAYDALGKPELSEKYRQLADVERKNTPN